MYVSVLVILCIHVYQFVCYFVCMCYYSMYMCVLVCVNLYISVCTSSRTLQLCYYEKEFKMFINPKPTIDLYKNQYKISLENLVGRTISSIINFFEGSFILRIQYHIV